MRLALAATALAASAAVLAATPASAAPRLQLGCPASYEPKTVTLACADAALRATGLRWSHWGAATATASGNVAVECRFVPPGATCHGPGTYSDTARLVASGRRTCTAGPEKGKTIYTKLIATETGSRNIIGKAGHGVSFPYSCGL